MGNPFIFLYKAIIFGLTAVVLIPKELYKKYMVYGILWGGFGNTLIISILGGLFHAIQYKNMGPFNIFNLFSFWTPIAWMFVIMIFLYCLPTRKLYLYIYILTFGIFGYMIGLVLQNYGLFEYIGIQKFIAPFIIIGWFAFAALFYIKAEKIELY